MDYAPLLIIVIAGVYLASSLRIVGENERFAVYALGLFVGLKGPGLVLKFPGSASKFTRVALGAEGEIQSNELALFGGNPMPYKALAALRAGSKIRVTGFEKAAVLVEAIQQFVVCEKCGHKNAV